MKKRKIKRKPTRVPVLLNAEQLTSLCVAVQLRIEALEENGDPDRFGWNILYRKLRRAARDL